MTMSTPPAARACASSGKAGFLKAVVPAEFGGMHQQLDVRTLCLAREILGFHDGLADFSFAMQGLGTGSITLFGSHGIESTLSAAGARRQGDRGLRIVGAGSRFRCRGAGHDRKARRQCACAARRQQDLDLQWRHRRSLRRVCAHRRSAGRERIVGLRGRCRYRRPFSDRTHRGDRAASARHPEIRQCARAGHSAAWRAGRRLQGRDGDARYFPLDRRRRGARLCAARLARNDRARGDAKVCSARRLAICS